MQKSQLVARRAAALTAGVGLAASALVAGAGAAQADDVVDITGVVTNAAGAPLANAFVDAYVQSGSQLYYVDSVTTDATGRYNFDDLDSPTLAVDYDGTSPRETAIRGAKSFKLFFGKNVPVAETRSNPGWLSRGFGGSKTITNATPVAVNGTTASTANQSLPSAGGVVVRITGAAGAPITGYGFARLYQPEAVTPIDASAAFGDTTDDDNSYDNPATPADEGDNAPKDGLVYISGVEPGSYVVEAGGEDSDATTGAFRSYISRFIGGNGSYADAVAVAVTGGAFTTTGVQLTDVLPAVEKPRIIGDSSFGSTLTADPGTWLQQNGTEFRYQWTRGGAAVPGATGATYKVTKADKKKKIGLVVTAVSRQEYVGSAIADPTSKVGEKSKVKAKRDGLAFDVTVKAQKKKVAKKVGTPKGKVALYTEDGELASKKAKLKGGQVQDLAPKRAFLGEKKFVVKYLGAGKLGSDTATAKLGGGKGGKKK